MDGHLPNADAEPVQYAFELQRPNPAWRPPALANQSRQRCNQLQVRLEDIPRQFPERQARGSEFRRFAFSRERGLQCNA